MTSENKRSLSAEDGKRGQVVYLDHSIWSNLGKHQAGFLGTSTPIDWGETLDSLRSLVRAGTIVCPISFAHAVELANYYGNPDVQGEMVQIMAELSQGACLPFIVIGNTAGRKPAICRAEALYPRGSLDAYMVYALRSIPAKAGLELILNGMITPSKIPSQVEEFIQDIMDKLGSRAGDMLVGTFSAPNASVDLRWLKEIIRLRLLDPGRGVEHGDAIDVMHLLFADAADFALVDKKNCKMIEKSPLLRFRVFYQIRELLAQLQELTV